MFFLTCVGYFKLNLNPTVHFDDHPPHTLSFVDIYFVGGNYCQLSRKSGKAMKEKEWENSQHHLPKTLTLPLKC
jgi:hypothetical protein